MSADYQFIDSIRLKEESFQKLLHLEYRMWIENNFDPIATIALAAFKENQLCALLVIDKQPSLPFALLQSFEHLAIFSYPEAKRMIIKMEIHLQKLHTSELGAQFEQGTYLSKIILNEPGWSKPYAKFKSFYFFVPDFNPSWFADPQPLPEGFTLSLWSKLSQQEKDLLELWSRQDKVLVSSNEDPYPRAEINSLILWYEGEIAGWMETHLLSENLIRYTSLYLFPQYRHLTLAASVLAASIKLQKESSITDALCELNIRETPLTWKNFINKRLAPQAYLVNEIDYSFKSFNMI